MKILVSRSREVMGERAARDGAQTVRAALRRGESAHIVLATGSSQFDMLNHLVDAAGIDWGRVTAFHLDEYIGMDIGHRASFRRYLKERFVDRLPEPLARFHFIDAEVDPEREIDRLNRELRGTSIDVAFVGIGENAHLAFNDPPADFETEAPYIRVRLDEACRRQQVREGWFDSLDHVPQEAVSMSIREIMKAQVIICTVPDARKAEAVKSSFEGPVTPDVPASVLQSHPDCRVFLDAASASRLAGHAARG